MTTHIPFDSKHIDTYCQTMRDIYTLLTAKWLCEIHDIDYLLKLKQDIKKIKCSSEIKQILLDIINDKINGAHKSYYLQLKKFFVSIFRKIFRKSTF